MNNNPVKQRAKTFPLRLAAVLILAAVFFAGCPVEDGEYEQSAPPEAAVSTLAKTAPKQKSVSFRLTSTHHAGSIWKVYDEAEGGGILTTVAVTYKKTINPADGEPISDLILTSFTDDLEVMIYFVSVTEQDRAESGRLALEVTNP
jgi:hypothetical protein